MDTFPRSTHPLTLTLEYLDYQHEDIKVLKDDGSDPAPTRENIVCLAVFTVPDVPLMVWFQLQAMDELMEDARAGDHFVFQCKLKPVTCPYVLTMRIQFLDMDLRSLILT